MYIYLYTHAHIYTPYTINHIPQTIYCKPHTANYFSGRLGERG